MAEGVRAEIVSRDPSRTVTILDGDLVRQNLSKSARVFSNSCCRGLGFSDQDRSTHVRRIGFVASEIVRHGGVAIVANIAPFLQDRQHNRKLISALGRY